MKFLKIFIISLFLVSILFIVFNSSMDQPLANEFEGDGIVRHGDYVEVVVHNFFDAEKDTLIGLEGYVSEYGDILLFNIHENNIDTFKNKVFEISKAAIVQPNFIYSLSAWSSSGGRSVPDDYDQTTHWNLEKINTPEAWDKLGGCSADNSCGGSGSVTVAVLDTGIAYEDWDYDAGSNYSLKKLSMYYVEVPGGPQNGVYNEGYDREYARSPELDNVTFDSTNDKDIAQEFLCLLSQIRYILNYQ